jgi:hypothetical protein
MLYSGAFSFQGFDSERHFNSWHGGRRTMRQNDDKLSCNFCGKGQREVKKLIAGPSVYICNGRIDICG